MTNNTSPRLPVWDRDLATIQEPAAAWLWHGFIAKGNVTLLTSQWKSGKTTLLAMLLSRRKTGGNLAGLAVQPGESVIVSEEPLPLWAERSRLYDFGGKVAFFPQPFQGIPAPAEWDDFIGDILALRQDRNLDLVVIDPLAPFCRGENQAKTILETLLPLRRLTSVGIAVLLMHHPGKGEKAVGQAARGSGALLGHVDIAIEMRHPGGNPVTRRRRLHAISRHAATPRRLLLELNPEGTDYLEVPDQQEDEFSAAWAPLRMVLEDAPDKLTRQNIHDDWPPDFEKPPRTCLWRLLDGAIQRNLVACEGSGRKSDPFRYWLPECELVWKRDPLYEMREEQRRLMALAGRNFDPDDFQRRMELFKEKQNAEAAVQDGDS